MFTRPITKTTEPRCAGGGYLEHVQVLSCRLQVRSCSKAARSRVSCRRPTLSINYQTHARKIKLLTTSPRHYRWLSAVINGSDTPMVDIFYNAQPPWTTQTPWAVVHRHVVSRKERMTSIHTTQMIDTSPATQSRTAIQAHSAHSWQHVTIYSM